MVIQGRYDTITDLYHDVLLFIGAGVDVKDMVVFRPSYELIYKDTPEDPQHLRLRHQETTQIENLAQRLHVFVDEEASVPLMSEKEKSCYDQVRSELHYGRLVLFVPKHLAEIEVPKDATNYFKK